MKENACESASSSLSSSQSLLLLGKSIAFQRHPNSGRVSGNKHQSINSNKSDINVTIPMRHSKRIKQLFLPVCLHEVQHEIANHYRDVKWKKAAKARTKAKRTIGTLFRHRKHRTKFAKLISTAVVQQRKSPAIIHRRLCLSRREILQIPSFTFPRVITQEQSINVRRGRQTLCTFRQPNDILSVESIENPSTARFKHLILCGWKEKLAQISTSFESINQANPVHIQSKSFESIDNHALKEHRTQTCHRQRQTCTTKRHQYHHHQQQQQRRNVDNRGIATTKTPTPNCNYRQHRKINSIRSTSDDANVDCINKNTSTNDDGDTEWYIHLASNCYRNGFQLHVNHLDEWSKQSRVHQRKPVDGCCLRLPSSALLSRSNKSLANLTKTVSSPSTCVSDYCNCHSYQLNIDEIKRIYCNCDGKHCNRTIVDPVKWSEKTVTARNLLLSSTDAQRKRRQQTENEPLNIALNAKNTMNTDAIDANKLHQANLQLSCQAIQYNYQNNNLIQRPEFYASARQQESHQIVTDDNDGDTIAAENNNYHRNQSINDDSGSKPFRLANDWAVEVKPKLGDDTVNDLIDTFNASFDISASNSHLKLPQIILSDFSSNQSTPAAAAPLYFTIQSSSRTLSEHPDQLQEYQLSKQHHPITTNSRI